MKTFKDGLGRDWTLEIDLNARKVVLARANVDFLDIEQVQTLTMIGDTEDLARLGDVLYVLCEDQIKDRSLTEKDFARGMKGDAFDVARAALEAELVDFFPAARRTILLKAMAKAKTLQKIVLDRANAKLDGDEIEKELIAKLSSDTSTD